jgi:hypothetical protein
MIQLRLQHPLMWGVAVGLGKSIADEQRVSLWGERKPLGSAAELASWHMPISSPLVFGCALHHIGVNGFGSKSNAGLVWRQPFLPRQPSILWFL